MQVQVGQSLVGELGNASQQAVAKSPQDPKTWLDRRTCEMLGLQKTTDELLADPTELIPDRER